MKTSLAFLEPQKTQYSWKYYTEAPLSADVRRVVQFWDTAFKSGAENDYSACTTWAETKTAFYLLHVCRARVEFPELNRNAVALAERWSPAVVLVEDKASGQSLLQELQRETSLPMSGIKVERDKVTRATAVTPLIEAGRVLLPQSASWLTEYLDELSSFPAAQHDDQVDSTVGALSFFNERVYGIFEFYRRQAEERIEKELAEKNVRVSASGASEKADA